MLRICEPETNEVVQFRGHARYEWLVARLTGRSDGEFESEPDSPCRYPDVTEFMT